MGADGQVVSPTMSHTNPAPSPRPEKARRRIALIFGGRSGEHAVSCATAAAVLKAIDRDRYDVLPIGITPEGQWVLVADDPPALELGGPTLPRVSAEPSSVVLPNTAVSKDALELRPGEIPTALGDVDVAFPLLHGPFGEDGTVQGLLEIAGIPYVGAGVLASAIGMDKQYMKMALAAHGLPVGPYLVISPRRWRQDRIAVLEEVEALGMPAFIKPARAGSSLGITRVEEAEDVPGAIAEAQRHDPKVLVEQELHGREIECAVLQGRDDEPPRVALPGEIVADSEFYDFEAKYLNAGGVELNCPADIADEAIGKLQELAAQAFEALGCEGLARVDFFVTDRGEFLINELNTMPGFTPYSMYPLMWQRSGLGYPELVEELVQLALDRPLGLR